MDSVAAATPIATFDDQPALTCARVPVVQDDLKDALNRFVAENHKMLRTVARTLTSNLDQADVLVQKAYVGLVANWPVNHPWTYMTEAIRNQAKNQRRDEARWSKTHVLAADPAAVRERATVAGPEHEVLLQLMIEDLSEIEFAIVSLKVATGMSNKKIGELLFMSETSVRNHLKKIERKLRVS